MRFSLNLPCLYRGDAYDTVLESVRRNGYDTVECWTLPPEDEMKLVQALEKYHVHLAAFCPDFFVLNDPSKRQAYRESLETALKKAARLHCPALITQVGQDTGAPRSEQHKAIVDGLRDMLPLLRQANVTLLVEPLNDVRDHPGYYLTDSQEGFEIIREVNDPHVRLLFDIYHQLHMKEDVQARIFDNLPLIGHFHVAGYPRRDEAIFETYDYAPLFDALEAAGCRVPIGLELRPSCSQAREKLLQQVLHWQDPQN